MTGDKGNKDVQVVRVPRRIYDQLLARVAFIMSTERRQPSLTEVMLEMWDERVEKDVEIRNDQAYTKSERDLLTKFLTLLRSPHRRVVSDTIEGLYGLHAASSHLSTEGSSAPREPESIRPRRRHSVSEGGHRGTEETDPGGSDDCPPGSVPKPRTRANG